MAGHEFYQAALVLIPLLLVFLATEDEFKAIRAQPGSSRTDNAILIGSALVLSSLILSAVVAMGALLREVNPRWAQILIVGSVGTGFALAAWVLGWSIWDAVGPRRQPSDLSISKSVYFGIGLATVGAVFVASAWAIFEGLAVLIAFGVVAALFATWVLVWFGYVRPKQQTANRSTPQWPPAAGDHSSIL